MIFSSLTLRKFIPEEASDYMLKQPNSLLFDELIDHVAEHSADGIEALISLADIGQAHIVQKDLLNDKDGHSLGEFRASLHDAKAKGDDFCRKQKVDNFWRVVLYERTNNAERR